MFSRMRSEGFPFIVWGLDPCSPRVARRVGVGSASRRRGIVNSVSMGEAAKPLLFEGFHAVVMSFCVAGVALCDIPTCLLPCRKFQNWSKSRTKCSFCCAHVSRLESLLFLWHRRVYGGSCKTSFVLLRPRHVSRLESLLFLWRRRVYGGSCKTSLVLLSLVFRGVAVSRGSFRRFPSRLSCQIGKCFVQAL